MKSNSQVFFNNLYWILLALAVVNLFFSVDYYRLHMPDDNAIAYLNYHQFHNYLATTDGMEYPSQWNHYSFIMSYFSGFLQTIFPNIYSLTKYLALIVTVFSLTTFYLFIKLLTTQLIALKSLVLFSLLPVTVVASHSPRPEMMIVGLIFYSLYVTHKYQTNNSYFWIAFLSAIAMDVHPSMLYIPILIIGWNFIMHKENIIRLIKYGSLGYLIGGILVVLSRIPIFDILLDTKTISYSIGSYDIFSWLSGMILSNRGVGIITFLVFIVPVIFLLIRKNGVNKIVSIQSLSTLSIISLVVYLAIGRLSDVYFLVPLTFFTVLFSLITQVKLRQLYIGVILLLLMYWVAIFFRYGAADYQKYGDKIVAASQSCLSSNTLIVASEYEWPFFKNYQFIAYENNSHKDKIKGRGVVIEETIRHQPLRSILFIVDELMADWIYKKIDWGSPLSVQIEGRPSKKTLEYFKKIGEVEDDFYGSQSNKKGVNKIEIFCKK
jgi:hypothetical protein